MPRPRLRAVLYDFNLQVQQSNSLLAAAKLRGTPFSHLEQIAELSFLRIFLAWESFLEESFARYLCGASAFSGFRPRCYARPRSIEHARDMLTLGAARDPKYVDWTNPQAVLRRAELVFKDGRPFVGPMRAALRDLDDMRIIRDCVAHRSHYAQGRLNQVILRHLGVSYNLRPGRFLLRRMHGTNQTYLDVFSQRILLLAQQLIQ